jgi:hypothetical protein
MTRAAIRGFVTVRLRHPARNRLPRDFLQLDHQRAA